MSAASDHAEKALAQLSRDELMDLAFTAYRMAGERVFVSIGVADLRDSITDTDLAGATDEQLQQAVDYAWGLDWSDETSAAKQHALNRLETIVNDAQ